MNFLSSSKHWADRAAQLGWDAMALFGCAPKRPLDYFGSAGLLWAINGGRLVELHRDWAVIDVPVYGSQRIFSRRNVDPAKITLPWAKQTSLGAVHRANRWILIVFKNTQCCARKRRPRSRW